MANINVDLPAPLAPISASFSPDLTFRDKLFIAFVPSGYSTVTLLIVSIFLPLVFKYNSKLLNT